MAPSTNPTRFKFVVVGDGTVGKTCLLMSFAKNEFPDKYVPTVFDNHISLISVDGTPYELELWDTAGQEDYDRLRYLSYPDTHLLLICFSVDSIESYKNVEAKWINEVKEHTQCPVFLVATKVDVRTTDSVSEAMGKDLAQRIGAAGYMETSAKERLNIHALFEQCVRVLVGKSRGGKSNGCCTMM